ncbi:pyridoxal phosphate-dependent decarboxylase family protein [Ruegeria sediminis]|uniref:pyridoxal phosphate-dependent decarboxylase family protein n=1 Tax=Ruegeria sediminis TaxID=2583820 RepID=UPI0014862DB4|nr:pyridoxal-dependent decarboxylase [Ruegeria sediminis]
MADQKFLNGFKGSRELEENEKLSLSEDDRFAMLAAAQEAIAYRESLKSSAVKPELRPADFASNFDSVLPNKGMPASLVIDDLITTASAGLHGHASPRFFGYVCGGSMPVGAAADFLVTSWGQNAASSWESPSAAVIEQTVCQWCLELLGLPLDSGVGIVSGATVANAQGIIAARDSLLHRQGWDVFEDGLFGAPDVPVVIGDAAHSAPMAGVRYAGLGLGRATRLATDDQGRISLSALRTELEACKNPPLVILQAGQINTGAFDPFAEAIPMIQDAGGWAHVDGAFGLWAHAVPSLRDRLTGVDGADSWAVDLHKWLNAPYDAGLCIVRDRSALVSAMSARGAYLPGVGETWEPSDSTLELSRRARGIPSYAIMRHLGADGIREMISRHCDMAAYLADHLSTVPGIEIVNDVVLNQVAIACGTDEKTTAVLERIQQRAQVYPSHGVWQGRQIIRVSIINHATSYSDIDLLIEEILDANGNG